MSNLSKKSSLGIGLSELLSDLKPVTNSKNLEARQIDIDLLEPGKYQPRRAINKEHLAELAASVKAQGIIQPLVIRPISSNKYEIIAGERRWRAAQMAGLQTVPAMVRNLSDHQAIAIALIENIQREDLNAIDTARSLQKLVTEFQMTHESAAQVIGKSRTMVTNLLRLLSLPPEVTDLVKQGLLEMGHARAILAVEHTQQISIAKLVVAKKLSVRECERLVKRCQQETNHIPKLAPRPDPDIRSLEQKLSAQLAASVTIKQHKLGKGSIVITYHSLNELDGILAHIK